ncbi:MAG: rod-binding protein [Spirochaetota bacterium]
MSDIGGLKPVYNPGYDFMLHTIRNNPEDVKPEFDRLLKEAIEKQGKVSDSGLSRGLRSLPEDRVISHPVDKEKIADGFKNSRNLDALSSKRLLEACYEMEALFIGTMLKQMRETIQESDFFGKSLAKEIFSDMLYDEYAKLMAKSEQIGLARQIYKQLLG